MTFLDTSLLIRYFSGDNPHKADRCEKLFQRAKAGHLTLWVSPLVIAETVWVLSKKYLMSRTDLGEKIRRLLNTSHILCDEAPLMLAAVNLYESSAMSFIDAYHAIVLPARGISELYSYDTDFDHIPGITRREP